MPTRPPTRPLARRGLLLPAVLSIVTVVAGPLPHEDPAPLVQVAAVGSGHERPSAPPLPHTAAECVLCAASASSALPAVARASPRLAPDPLRGPFWGVTPTAPAPPRSAPARGPPAS
jgi:hypothetical protein